MARRSELDHRVRELLAALVNRLAARALNRRTTGLDGIAKRLLPKPSGALVHDPELDHLDNDWHVPGPASKRE